MYSTYNIHQFEKSDTDITEHIIKVNELTLKYSERKNTYTDVSRDGDHVCVAAATGRQHLLC